MNKQHLVMKYHPAKKEVEFHRFQNGKEVPIRKESRLMYYMNQRGKFVLQDHGNKLFADIARAFDGLKTLEIYAVMTRLDYDDFCQMVEFYNDPNNDPNNEEKGRCHITHKLLAELPDMAQTYENVKKHGEEAISILETRRQKLFDVRSDNPDVRASAEEFAKQIDMEIRNIREKINVLNENTVNLCFTGVFSAGKSSVINALIGYQILPEATKAQTAKMYRIRSPKVNEKVSILFGLCGEPAEIMWNESGNQFEFIEGLTENKERGEIQQVLTNVKEQKQHDQIRAILKDINVRNVVSPDVTVLYPTGLDNERVQFMIYDTPGTGNNYMHHRDILQDALLEQTQSILVFVCNPTQLEGQGNHALLEYLKKAEEKSSKTSIDIGRSLFVMNFADSVLINDRIETCGEKIPYSEDDSFSINLADKKLFFTSARYANAAMASINKVSTKSSLSLMKTGLVAMVDDDSEYACCYRQNHCATSEIATKKMTQESDQALLVAKNNHNDAEALLISSGLYALRQEILLYAEKYASAVKAFAIIDSVDKALKKLNNSADSLRDKTVQNINLLQSKIDTLEAALTDAIEGERENYALSEEQSFPNEWLQILGLDEVSFINSQREVAKYLNGAIKGSFFSMGKKARLDKVDSEKISNDLDDIIRSFSKRYESGRKDLLTKQRDKFIQAVQKRIKERSDISEEAKHYVLDIPAPNIPPSKNLVNIPSVFEQNKEEISFLFFLKYEYLKKEEAISAVETEVGQLLVTMRDEYVKEYKDSLTTILGHISGEFKSRLQQYSLFMNTLIKDREAMTELGKKVDDAARELMKCQSQLNATIWKETRHA